MSAARCERCGGVCRGGALCPMWGQAPTERRVVGEPDLTDLDAVVGRVERIVAREEQHGGGNASLFDRYGCLLYDPSDAVIGNRSTLAVSDLRALLAALRAAREDATRWMTGEAELSAVVDRIERENAALRDRVAELHKEIQLMAEAFVASRVRVARLREALEDYGEHRTDCPVFYDEPCDCGLSRALEPLE